MVRKSEPSFKALLEMYKLFYLRPAFNDKNVEITGRVSVKCRLQTIVFTMQMST